MNVLELYSGIGGMHYAFKTSNIPGQVVAAVEINTVANEVYKHNFPNSNLLNRNIESLPVEQLNKLDINMILMSPPCQPFTRNGNFGDEQDPRTDSFLHVLSLIPQLKTLKYILVENVKGFECSNTRDQLIETLKKASFRYQEFIISPSEIKIPNTRHRYYCLAKNQLESFGFTEERLKIGFPDQFQISKETFSIHNIIEQDINEIEYLIKDNALKKYINLLDICYSDSQRSCCFTKAYGRYLEGTGSVYTPLNQNEAVIILNQLKQFETSANEYLISAKTLKLRHFTPKEVASLMCFPQDFSFPTNITKKQRYRLLGNSINVKIVAELLKILIYNPNKLL